MVRLSAVTAYVWPEPTAAFRPEIKLSGNATAPLPIPTDSAGPPRHRISDDGLPERRNGAGLMEGAMKALQSFPHRRFPPTAAAE